MANKTTAIYVRVEPVLKEQAEIVYKNIGISLSSAINIFLKQSVINNGFPFQVTNKPIEKPVETKTLTREQLIDEIMKGHEDIEKGDVIDAKKVFEELEKEFNK